MDPYDISDKIKIIKNDNIVKKSTNYIDDQKILKYCNENPQDSQCDCIILNNNIKLLQINSFSPYVCWYSGCLLPDNYKTSLIINEQERCNVTNCIIKLNDIFIDSNGKLNIENNCGSLFTENTNIISQSLLDRPLKVNYEIPNYFIYSMFPIILGVCFVCFLLK